MFKMTSLIVKPPFFSHAPAPCPLPVVAISKRWALSWQIPCRKTPGFLEPLILGDVYATYFNINITINKILYKCMYAYIYTHTYIHIYTHMCIHILFSSMKFWFVGKKWYGSHVWWEYSLLFLKWIKVIKVKEPQSLSSNQSSETTQERTHLLMVPSIPCFLVPIRIHSGEDQGSSPHLGRDQKNVSI